MRKMIVFFLNGGDWAVSYINDARKRALHVKNNTGMGEQLKMSNKYSSFPHQDFENR